MTYSSPERPPDARRRKQSPPRGRFSPGPYLVGLLGVLLVGGPGFLLLAAFAEGGDALWILMGVPVLGGLMLIGLVLIGLAVGLAQR
jgi:hypothetical protein